MALLNVDLNNPESMERPAYEPLEAGQYELEIVNDLVVVPSKSNPDGPGVIAIELRDPETGKTVRDWISLHEKMQWYKNQFVASAGVPEVGDGQVDLDDFKGRMVGAIVKQETYQKNDGTTGFRNTINSYIYD